MSIYKNKKTGNANLHSQSLYLLLSYNSSANNRRNNCPSRRVALRPDLYFSVTFPTLFQCLLHIPPDIQHRITICHKTPIFKMMIKAPVIQIDRAASRHAIICHAHLRMTEPRCPLIDPYTILYQIVIERSGDTVDQLLIRDSRCDDPHIHATPGRQRKCMCHLIRDDQIRSHEPAVSIRFVDDTDIDILSNLDSV